METTHIDIRLQKVGDIIFSHGLNASPFVKRQPKLQWDISKMLSGSAFSYRLVFFFFSALWLIFYHLFYFTVKACLKAHNERRALHGASPLVWDDTLVEHAQIWADHLAETGKIRHDPNRDGEGENIAWFKGHKTADCEDALVGWLVALKFCKQFISQKSFLPACIVREWMRLASIFLFFFSSWGTIVRSQCTIMRNLDFLPKQVIFLR